ncbi:hypothetical protein FDP41_012412 [Naegleria fowleri]|uniref:Uncharacterized protein n=1 Tax=Naegleria fowleri TaxID=5763 RepID=A0A6A5C8P9_NAEFO|nr:uncharacterized protein FDP41_012412 [Naegleria fowleri]KAF0981755.1 hypothetical protein FDP41_012412 [Naegleria fowleri]CAG4711270.1 unnamed protein product [Naegleria fowleri]
MPRLEFPTGFMRWRLDKASPFYASDRKVCKSQTADQFTELFERFNFIMILNLSGVETNELQEFRRALSNRDYDGYSELYIGKHSLTRLAIDGLIQNLKKKNHCIVSSHDEQLVKALTKLKEVLVGEIGLLFTNCENYYALKKEMAKHVLIKSAKVGSIATDNAYFEGKTGLSPLYIHIFQANGINSKIRMGQVELYEKQRILKVREVCSHEKVQLLNLLRLKVIRKQMESLYLFSKHDAIIVSDELLERDWFDNCLEAANQMTALSMECSLMNELTILADIKKGILNLVVLDTETNCEMRYMLRKDPPPIIDDEDTMITDESSSESSEWDYLDLFS